MSISLVRLPLVLLALMLVSTRVEAQVCGDGAIAQSEGCDDGNTANGDGCDASCAVENGWFCVPSLHASGVNPAGVALAQGSTDPHWVWSLSSDGSNPTPGYVSKYGAWGSLPPGNWITTDTSFGAGLTTQPDTYWFQNVFMPASFAGNLTFPVAVAADNAAEVFINGTSYGSLVGFGAATSITIPSSAFVPGNNVVSIRLNEYIPGTPRGILMYPGGGGILSQCTRGCNDDGDCDDGNDCTNDSCITGACHAELLPLGTTCTSTGICGPADPVPVCLACVNTSTTVTSTVPDLGCDQSFAFCDESGTDAVCVECETDDHCAPGLSCSGGTCVGPTVDAGVEDTGLADAGEADTGLPTDAAGPGSDAALIDTGVDSGIDAGSTSPTDSGAPGTDSGAKADGGQSGDAGEDAAPDEGCACSTAPSSPARWSLAWGLLCPLVLLARRRRRRG